MVAVHHDVLGLEIAMDDALFMRGGEAADNLAREVRARAPTGRKPWAC